MVHHDLIDSGEQVSRPRGARLMKAAGIQSKMAKRFVITTNSKNTHAPAPDRLKREFRVSHHNKVWVADTTFIRTRQGWLYLAMMMDLYSRQIIGWAMFEHNDTQLVTDALNMSIARRGQNNNVIVHLDQGSSNLRAFHLLVGLKSKLHFSTSAGRSDFSPTLLISSGCGRWP
ncbi:MAG: DDE-type integrase/transposase/recombinase [Gammaproteobacteria bacterium]|nr:DDE-type integrase/transposase/recombinase [Gammaproteobacteria bacterium]